MQTFEGAKVIVDSRGKALQTLEIITPEFRFESLYLSDFQSESLYSYYLQSLQRLSTRILKVLADFRGESICRLSWKVFADLGGNNARISLKSPYLVFQGKMTAR